MFCTHDWWYDMRDLFSWWRDFRDRLDRKRASKSSWQTTEATTATAMAEDVDRPKEKPRPPSGGQISLTDKPELVPILVASKLNSPACG